MTSARKLEIRGERARTRHDRRRLLLGEECLGQSVRMLDERHESCLREATSQLELVIVDGLGERLPARHDDGALPVRERNHHRADSRMGHEHPR